MNNIEKQIGELEQQEQALIGQLINVRGQAYTVELELAKLQSAINALKKAKTDVETVPGQ